MHADPAGRPEQPVVTFLNGLPHTPLAAGLETTLGEIGSIRAVHHLGDEVFAPCQGCFECWTAKPGQCKANDASNQVMRDIIASDLVVFSTKLRFGCWSPVTKAALDKSIGLLSPFFTTVSGETHHVRRYRRYPRWVAIAVVGPDTTPEDRALFRTLVARNALNMRSEASRVVFVPGDAESGTLRSIVRPAIAEIVRADPDPFPVLASASQRADAVGVAPLGDRPRHAVLWVGSAKPQGTSTSEALGSFLLAQLGLRGWTSEVVHVARAVRFGREQAPRLAAAVSRADLLVLAAPVYVDCLHALVLAGFAQLAHSELGKPPPALLPIVQCGFPEIEHTALAVAVAGRAADGLGLRWAGHLALGGGGLIGGKPLAQLGARVDNQVRALERAAEELDQGRPVSAATADRFAKVPLSPAVYRTIGDVSWLHEALQHGALWKLWERPFA